MTGRPAVLLTAAALLVTACGPGPTTAPDAGAPSSDPAATEPASEPAELATEPASELATEPAAGSTAGTGRPQVIEGGRELDRIDPLPEEAAALPPLAADPGAGDALIAAAVALGADPDALTDVDLAEELLVAFDLGPCATGEAVLTLAGDRLHLAGRTSDGVCDAIDHEVQLWAVPWSALPDQVVVDGVPASRP